MFIIKNSVPIIIICLIMTTNLSGCVNENKNTNNITENSINNEAKSNYEICPKKYNKDKISIEYPQIQGLNNDLETTWNKRMEDVALSYAKEITSDDTLEITYEVKTKSKKLISIFAKGDVYYGGRPHPSKFAYTHNINLENQNNIRLKDTNKTEEFAQNIFEDKNFIIKKEGFEDYDNLSEDFNTFLKATFDTKEKLINHLNDYDFDYENSKLIPPGYSYYENDKLVLCFETGHALGDYVQLVMG